MNVRKPTKYSLYILLVLPGRTSTRIFQQQSIWHLNTAEGNRLDSWITPNITGVTVHFRTYVLQIFDILWHRPHQILAFLVKRKLVHALPSSPGWIKWVVFSSTRLWLGEGGHPLSKIFNSSKTTARSAAVFHTLLSFIWAFSENLKMISPKIVSLSRFFWRHNTPISAESAKCLKIC